MGACSKRDKRGWRIPREGTISHEIYRLAIAGAGMTEIAKKLKTAPFKVKNLLFKIRNPEVGNANENAWRKSLPARRRREMYQRWDEAAALRRLQD